MPKVFISYSVRQSAVADRIFAAASELGFDVYKASRSNAPGENWIDRIGGELDSSDFFCMVWSQDYNKSNWCKNEWQAWLQKTGSVGSNAWIAFSSDNTHPPGLLSSLHCETLPRKKTDQSILFNARFSDLLKVRSGVRLSTKTDEALEEMTERFEEFHKIASTHEKRLQQREFKRESSIDFVRTPKFILCERAGNKIIAVVDEGSEVFFDRLQRSNEPQISARYIDENLEDIGFAHNYVHPQVRSNRASGLKIFVDANIFFQFLFSPRSKIIVPAKKRAKRRYYISSFIRSLLDFHGSDNVVFANFAKAHWTEDPFYPHLEALAAHSRFAPTPSNSLHFGSVRSALIPLLLSKRFQKDGMMLLRFDDTRHPDSDNYKSIISEDLAWLGLTFDGEFSQTDNERNIVYQEVLKTLVRKGYARDDGGDVSLDVDFQRLGQISWFDANKGPIIRHSLPPLKSAAKGSPNRVLFPRGERFPRYRFAGSVDDLLHSTHIVRDIQQETLTQVQAAIRQSIHACIENDIEDRDGLLDPLRSRLSDQSMEMKGERRRATPLFSPPIYYHAPVVVDENLQKISKRSALSYSDTRISDIREKHLFLPETLIALLCSTIAPHIPKYSPQVLGGICAKLGCRGFLAEFAKEFRLNWLQQNYTALQIQHESDGSKTIKRRSHAIRVTAKQLWATERAVLAGLNQWQLEGKIRRFNSAYECIDIQSDLAGRLFQERSNFRSWYGIRNLLQLNGPPRNAHVRQALINLVTARRDSGSPISALSCKQLAHYFENVQMLDVRRYLMGNADGPPLATVLGILETEGLAEKLGMRNDA